MVHGPDFRPAGRILPISALRGQTKLLIYLSCSIKRHECDNQTCIEEFIDNTQNVKAASSSRRNISVHIVNFADCM